MTEGFLCIFWSLFGPKILYFGDGILYFGYGILYFGYGILYFGYGVLISLMGSFIRNDRGNFVIFWVPFWSFSHIFIICCYVFNICLLFIIIFKNIFWLYFIIFFNIFFVGIGKPLPRSCREFFFSKIFVFFNFVRPDFFRILMFVVIFLF